MPTTSATASGDTGNLEPSVPSMSSKQSDQRSIDDDLEPSSSQEPSSVGIDVSHDQMDELDEDQDDATGDELDSEMHPQDESAASSVSSGGPDWDKGDADALVHEMASLVTSVPQLQGNYMLVSLLGEGTFSTVYKAIDLRHDQYDNTLWHTPWAMMPVVDREKNIRDPLLAYQTPAALHLATQKAKGKVYVALKRIYVTSSPERIMGEIDILNMLRGMPNVAYLISAIRHDDQVIVVMPFNRHQDFREFYNRWTVPFMRSYLACLFRALAATHSQHIIHRDVKPANFLFDVHSGTGVLCDFGLAEKTGGSEQLHWQGLCCHSLPGPSVGGLKSRARATKRTARLPPNSPPGLAAGLHGARLVRPISPWTQLKAQTKEWDTVRARVDEKGRQFADLLELQRLRPWLPSEEEQHDLLLRHQDTAEWYKRWRGPDQPGQQGPGVGVLMDEYDRRPHVRANRAGTRGFRAPEVLLKCPDQTVSIDIWSVGIMILCFLTYRFPFFHSNDDTEALAELTAIFGKHKMRENAALHNRTFQTNIPDYSTPAHASLDALVESLNPSIFPPTPEGRADIKSLIDLMKSCLEVDLTVRWTAEEVLEHPFFDGVFDMGDGHLAERGPLHARVADWED